MKEIILIAVIVGCFIFFFSFLFKIFIKKPKKTAEKKEEKKVEEIKENKKEDIPEILKTVTEGNYMKDISSASAGEVDFEENLSIEKPEVKKSVADAFDEISSIGIDFEDEIDDEISEIHTIESDLNDDIDNDFNDSVLLDEEEIEEENTVAKEYKGLSKEMKAIIIANILEKKNK